MPCRRVRVWLVLARLWGNRSIPEHGVLIVLGHGLISTMPAPAFDLPRRLGEFRTHTGSSCDRALFAVAKWGTARIKKSQSLPVRDYSAQPVKEEKVRLSYGGSAGSRSLATR
jgi:hypothetical protein